MNAHFPARSNRPGGRRRGWSRVGPAVQAADVASPAARGPVRVDVNGDWEGQFVTLQEDIRNRAHFAKVAAEKPCADALILDADRDPADVVVRRTGALLASLGSEKRARAGVSGTRSREAASGRRAIAVGDTPARHALFLDACRLRRQIMLANPLLDFDSIVFVKQDRALYDHMCDQYYGMAAKPGGGSTCWRALRPRPGMRDVLADAKIGGGGSRARRSRVGACRPAAEVRRRGQPARPAHHGGTFLSPDLSYDGKTILFAYVECKGEPAPPAPYRSLAGTLGRGPMLPRLQGERGRLRARATDGRHLERFRSLLASQRPDRLHLRTSRRLPALWAGLPQLHPVRHGVRRQRHHLSELP